MIAGLVPGPGVDEGREANVADEVVGREQGFVVVEQFMSSEQSAIDHGRIDAAMAEFDVVESLLDGIPSGVLDDVW